MNARIGKEGNLNDGFIGHLGNLLTDREDNPTYDISSCDNYINRSGRKILNLCDNRSLKIGNGQTSGDRLENFTFQSSKGYTMTGREVTI